MNENKIHKYIEYFYIANVGLLIYNFEIIQTFQIWKYLLLNYRNYDSLVRSL